MTDAAPDTSGAPGWEEVRGRRRVIVIILGLLLGLSLVLPHVAVRADMHFGRSLLASSVYFLNIEAVTFGTGVNTAQLALGINVTYLGLALHQLGLALGLASFWSLYPIDIQRFFWWLMLFGGVLLTLSAPLVVTGWGQVASSGVPAELGIAWLPALMSGVALVTGALRSRDRIDRTWYAARPELNG